MCRRITSAQRRRRSTLGGKRLEVVALGLGVPGSNFDLDAIAWDDADRLLFSLQSKRLNC